MFDSIEDRKVELARQRARIDQFEKMFEDQYAMRSPRVNRWRLEDLEVWKFSLEIKQYELDEYIKMEGQGES